MKIHILKVGLIKTNCYVIWDETTLDAVVIDPGDEASVITEFLEENKLFLKYILITHGHYDHLLAVPEVSCKYDAEVICHEDAKKYLMDPKINLGFMHGELISIEPDKLVKEGDIIHIRDIDFMVLDVPGHANGSACYYINKERIVFSGDTLFMDTIGITDFVPDGNHELLVKSIKEKLLTLPDETIVYPGHGAHTTVGHEKKNNPYLK